MPLPKSTYWLLADGYVLWGRDRAKPEMRAAKALECAWRKESEARNESGEGARMRKA